MTRDEEIDVLSIHDLAAARLRNPPLDPNVEHDLKEIVRLAERLLSPSSRSATGEEDKGKGR